MKILVIDDDAAVRKFIGLTLKQAGYDVLEGENGREGMKTLQEHRDISLMITDIIMPEKEGIETIMEVKKLYPSLKIIAISGGGKAGPQSYLVLADAFGVNATLAKPFSGKELLLCMEQIR
ncbi:MAG: response regulator [Chlorobiaceae bacterium]|jgi:CheY-like chemotaxis protein|nr:response regulator [Chlorobiaceae bacterium]NTV60933.1 response regulator [Chlorobiaceae bacterium]